MIPALQLDLGFKGITTYAPVDHFLLEHSLNLSTPLPYHLSNPPPREYVIWYRATGSAVECTTFVSNLGQGSIVRHLPSLPLLNPIPPAFARYYPARCLAWPFSAGVSAAVRPL